MGKVPVQACDSSAMYARQYESKLAPTFLPQAGSRTSSPSPKEYVAPKLASGRCTSNEISLLARCILSPNRHDRSLDGSSEEKTQIPLSATAQVSTAPMETGASTCIQKEHATLTRLEPVATSSSMTSPKVVWDSATPLQSQQIWDESAGNLEL